MKQNTKQTEEESASQAATSKHGEGRECDFVSYELQFMRELIHWIYRRILKNKAPFKMLSFRACFFSYSFSVVGFIGVHGPNGVADSNGFPLQSLSSI